MTMLDRRSLLLGVGASLAAGRAQPAPAASEASPAAGKAAQLLASARTQVGVTLTYDPAYTALPFPGGDVPREKGVCTDVIIRAYRDALGLDLQALVNADMRAAFGAYPRTWGLAAPDRNIDHRRVPNLRVWFARQHAELPIPRDPSGWQPGDIFTSLLAKTATHIGFVSDRQGAGSPLVIHNIGSGAREEDALLDWPITGRYRWAI
jgi:uncharacterized protein YijF (DUF1287 family)